MPPIVRQIRSSDLDAYKALRLEALQNHPTAFGSDYAETLAQPQSYWVARVNDAIDNPSGCIVLADAGEELAGMCGIFRSSGTKVEHTGTVWGVYVRPPYRGEKLVDRMFDELWNWSRRNGVRIARLTASTCAVAAIRCYGRCGFSVYGLSPEEIRVDGKYYDEMLMWRRI